MTSKLALVSINSWANLRAQRGLLYGYAIIARVTVSIAAIAVLLMLGWLCVRYLRNMRKSEAAMNELISAAYPRSELPDNGGTSALQMDCDRERSAPYYKRTRHHLNNIYDYDPVQLTDGSWYGCDEWVQDIIAGRVDLENIVD